MIERPRRSVTRFFVPLIDVLILLFCIFLLMPFVTVPESDNAPPGKNKEEDELPKDVRDLRDDLERYKRELERLKAEKGNLSDRLSVKVLEIDAENGNLYYFQDGERVGVTRQAEAETLIGIHKNQSATREPFFLILYPRRRSGYPEKPQVEQYERWFKDVQFKFDRPFAPAP